MAAATTTVTATKKKTSTVITFGDNAVIKKTANKLSARKKAKATNKPKDDVEYLNKDAIISKLLEASWLQALDNKAITRCNQKGEENEYPLDDDILGPRPLPAIDFRAIYGLHKWRDSLKACQENDFIQSRHGQNAYQPVYVKPSDISVSADLYDSIPRAGCFNPPNDKGTNGIITPANDPEGEENGHMTCSAAIWAAEAHRERERKEFRERVRSIPPPFRPFLPFDGNHHKLTDLKKKN
jgi:hypothetical protein